MRISIGSIRCCSFSLVTRHLSLRTIRCGCRMPSTVCRTPSSCQFFFTALPLELEDEDDPEEWWEPEDDEEPDEWRETEDECEPEP